MAASTWPLASGQPYRGCHPNLLSPLPTLLTNPYSYRFKKDRHVRAVGDKTIMFSAITVSGTVQVRTQQPLSLAAEEAVSLWHCGEMRKAR